MICTSLQHKTYEQILDILDNPWVELAEIRLDLCTLSDEEIEDLFASSDTPLVATCRIDKLGEKEAYRRLQLAIEAGARFADLELEASAAMSKNFRNLCEECGTEIIRSYHDYNGTPDAQMLEQILGRCYRYGAEIAKVVTTASTQEEVATVLSLYQKRQNKGLIAFAMGPQGKSSRLDCLKLGAPFTYAALSEDEATAAGQWPLNQMYKAVYGDFKGFFRNSLQMPASKSFAQRAIIAAALSQGRSHLYNYSPCDDSEAAIAVARALGAKVRKDETTLTIEGTNSARTALQELHTGESGLLTRLCIPLMAALNDGPVRITGEKTLTQRPLKGVSDIMASLGVLIKEDKVPINVEGPLMPGNAEISGKDGSQLISGLLMALPLCDKPSNLYIEEPKSLPYMFITCDVLKKFGVKIAAEMEGDAPLVEEQDWNACTQVSFKIKAPQRYKAANFEIEGDWSSAANFLVAGAIFGKAEVSGLDTKSLQADLAIASILVQAGAIVSELDDVICVSKAPLEAFDADLNNSPDIIPIVSIFAAFCDGQSHIYGVNRLIGKESNRAEAILEMLLQMGVEARIEGDEMLIDGQTLVSRIQNGKLLKGGKYTSSHDHRMAMALKIASIGAESPIEIDDCSCAAKSFPAFWEMFDN